MIWAVAGLLGLLATSAAQAAAPRSPVGTAARLAPGVVVTGPVAHTQRMRVTIGMVPRDPLGLSAFSEAVATPGSPQYGHYLTVRAFARRFGAPQAALIRVRRTLRADGLTVTAVAADRLSITAWGGAQRIERVFATRLEWAREPRGRSTIIDIAPPSVPRALARDVAVVLGLDGLGDPAPAGPSTPSRGLAASPPELRSDPLAGAGPSTGALRPCAAASAAAAPRTPGPGGIPAFGYTAGTLDAAYGVPSLAAHGDLGRGQTVAVYEQQSLDPRDIATYQACYGTHATVRIRDVDTPDPVDAGIGGDGEAALDVEQIIGVAPRASVIVYAASQTDADAKAALLSAIASQNAAKIVSISDSTCESELGRAAVAFEAKLFEEMAAQGQSVFASTGDQGAEECSPPNGEQTALLAVGDPASQPTVTAVGGTSLYSGAAAFARPWDETGSPTEGVWNSGSFRQNGVPVGQASTGGLSSLWAMPRFQSSAPASLGVRNAFTLTGRCGAAACREVPDVSADADPSTGTVIYADGGQDGRGGSSWVVDGGTSASAPLWAGLAALTDAQPSCEGLSIGDINPALYRLARSGEGTLFRDVRAPSAFTAAESNDASGAHPGIYPVGPGYDLATGLGTPLMGRLAPALCALRVGPTRFGAVSLSAIERGQLRLRFMVTRSRGPQVRSVTVRLEPGRGLRFGSLSRRVFVSSEAGGHRRALAFTLSERPDALTIRLRHLQTAVRIELGRGALRAGPSLARRAAHDAAVTVALSATDARLHTTRRVVRLRVPRVSAH